MSFFEVQTEFGSIRVKKSSGYGAEKFKPEFDSVREAAEKYGVPFNKVYNSVVINKNRKGVNKNV